MGCFQSKNNKYKAKPYKIVKTVQGEFNARWKRSLETPNIQKFIIDDCSGVAEHPAFRTIQKDLERTFPNHKHFKNTENIQTFRQVLKCYALTFPTIGYTQGLNFIAGYFLIHKANKNQCLNLLVSLSSHPQLLCHGLYEDGFPLARLYCQMFWTTLQKLDQELYNCLKLIDIPDDMWIFQWYLTFFLYSFPLEYIAFYFNYLFQYKQFGMVKLSLGIILCLRKDILDLPKKIDEDLIKILQNLKELDSCQKIFNFQTAIEKAYLIPNKMISQSLKKVNKANTIQNFYIKYFSACQQQKKTLYGLFLNEINSRNILLSSSKHDSKHMATYKRSRQTVQILDQILVESIRRQKLKTHKSNMFQMQKPSHRRNANPKKWRSLFEVSEDVNIQDQTNVSIVRKVVIPEEE